VGVETGEAALSSGVVGTPGPHRVVMERRSVGSAYIMFQVELAYSNPTIRRCICFSDICKRELARKRPKIRTWPLTLSEVDG